MSYESNELAYLYNNCKLLICQSEDDSDDDEDEEMVNEEECALCGGDEGLINCSSCPSAFHMECHVPPLRREPRYVTK